MRGQDRPPVPPLAALRHAHPGPLHRSSLRRHMAEPTAQRGDVQRRPRVDQRPLLRLRRVRQRQPRRAGRREQAAQHPLWNHKCVQAFSPQREPETDSILPPPFF